MFKIFDITFMIVDVIFEAILFDEICVSIVEINVVIDDVNFLIEIDCFNIFNIED